MEQTQRVEEPSTLTSQTTTSNKSTKEELISCIKEWIKIDNDIAKAKSDIKEKTSRKKTSKKKTSRKKISPKQL